MKKIILLTSLISSIALAQMPPGINPENLAQMQKAMKQMMAGANDIEQCMSTINQDKMDELSVKASKLEEEVSQLCDQGKRSVAQDKAITFRNKMKNNSEMRKMKKCMAPMSAIMQSTPFEDMYKGIETGKSHVCDR